MSQTQKLTKRLHLPYPLFTIIQSLLNLPIPQGIIHIGKYTKTDISAYQKVLVKSSVYIEPVPTIFQQLKKDLGDIPNHYPIQEFCSDVDDRIINFNLDRDITPTSNQSLLKDNRDSCFQIKTKTLDRLCDRNFNKCNFDLLVINTPGTQLKVLMGSHKLLTNQLKYIYSEVSEEPLYEGGSTLEEITTFLKAYGFRLKNLAFHQKNLGQALYVKNLAEDTILENKPKKILM